MKLPFLPLPHAPAPPTLRMLSHLPLPMHLRGPLRALNLVAGSMASIPLFQLAPHIWPLEPFSTAWRYAAYSNLAGGILAPLGGIVLAHWVAALQNNRARQALIAAASVAVGAVMLGAAPIFLHDYLSLRDDAARAMRGAIDSAAWRSLFAGIIGGLTLCVVGATGWRSAHVPAPGQIRKKGGSGGLVVGQEGTDELLGARGSVVGGLEWIDRAHDEGHPD